MALETKDAPSQYVEGDSMEIEETLYARHAELKSLEDLTDQRGTPIPALFNQFYKFIQNPSSVSVETYKRMVDTDDTVGSGVDFLTTCLAARLGRYQHKSTEITGWVNNRLDEVEGGFFNIVKELLSATWAGFAVAEKVWANTENGFVPKRIVAFPPSSILFETDRCGQLTEDGILQYQRNFNPMAMASGVGNFFGGGFGFGFSSDAVRPDMFAKFGDLPFPVRSNNSFSYLSIRIPRQKCVHYAFDAQGKFGNHYGRSLLRRAYKYYVMKDAILQMMIVALDRKGTPLTIIYADHGTTLIDPKKKAAMGGNVRNKASGIRADEAAHEAFKNIHNDSFIVLPGKKGQIFDTDFVPQDSNTEAFIEALNFCNKSIMRALLIPSLIFNAGDGAGSFSLGQEHSRTFDKILDGMLAGMRHVLVQQVIKDMVAYNFPKSAWAKDGLGDFSKREFSQDERQKEAEMFEKAIDNGIVDTNDMNDLNKMRDTLGFEPRETPIQKPDPFGLGLNGDEPTFDPNADPDAPPSVTKRSGGGSSSGGRRGKGEEPGIFDPAQNLK